MTKNLLCCKFPSKIIKSFKSTGSSMKKVFLTSEFIDVFAKISFESDLP